MIKKIFFVTFLCFIINTSTYATNKPSKKIVFVNMVADLFHAGHVNFLKQAKTKGDFLIVGLHSDENTAKYKRQPVCNIEERCAVIESCKYVDKVICDTPLIINEEFINKHNIDLIVHGDDFNQSKIEEFYSDAIKLNKFATVPYSQGISTTDIIERIVTSETRDIDKRLSSLITELEAL